MLAELTFLQALIISYAILTLAFLLLLISTKWIRGKSKYYGRSRLLGIMGSRFTSTILYVVLLAYIVLSALSISAGNGIVIWAWIISLSATYIVLFSSIILGFIPYNSHYNRVITVMSMFIIALTLVLTPSSISGFKPLVNDEGRFTGFSYRIISEGFWRPYKYPENPYYQTYHALPVTISMISLFTGAKPHLYTYIMLKLCVVFFNTLLLYLIAKETLCIIGVKDPRLPLIAPLIAVVTPPLSLLGLIPRNISYLLFLLTFYLTLKVINSKALAPKAIILYVLYGTASVLIHPIGPYLTLLLALSLGIYVVMYGRDSRELKELFLNLLKVTLVLVIIYQSYWLYSFAVFAYKQSVENLWTGFVEFMRRIMVQEEPTATYAIREPWYRVVPRYLLIAWAFLPALTTAYILYRIIVRGTGKPLMKLIVLLGVTSLLVVAFSFAQRFTSGLTVYLGYKVYSLLLLFPLLYIPIVKKSRKVLSCIFTLMVVSCLIIGAITPEVNPEALNIIPTATNTGWATAEILHKLITPQYTKSIVREVRIGLNMFILKEKPYLFEFYNYRIESKIVLLLAKNTAHNVLYYNSTDYNKVFDYGVYTGIVGEKQT